MTHNHCAPAQTDVRSGFWAAPTPLPPSDYLCMKRFWLLFSQAVTVLLAAYFIVATLQPSWLRGGATVSRAGISLSKRLPSPGPNLQLAA